MHSMRLCDGKCLFHRFSLALESSCTANTYEARAARAGQGLRYESSLAQCRSRCCERAERCSATCRQKAECSSVLRRKESSGHQSTSSSSGTAAGADCFAATRCAGVFSECQRQTGFSPGAKAGFSYVFTGSHLAVSKPQLFRAPGRKADQADFDKPSACQKERETFKDFSN